MIYEGVMGEPSTLFVGDLSSCCTEDDLHEEFSKYGAVKHVRIQRTRDKASGQRVSVGYGFVKMGDIGQALIALEAVNGACIAGRNVRVRQATHHMEDSNKQESKMSLYVKFVGCTPAAQTNEAVIREVFSQFGAVEDVTIRKQFVDGRKHIKRGYAFVHYTDDLAGLQSALRILSYFPTLVHSHQHNDLKFNEADVIPSYNQVIYTSSPSKSLNEALSILQDSSDGSISLTAVAEDSSLANQMLAIDVRGGRTDDYSLDISLNGNSTHSDAFFESIDSDRKASVHPISTPDVSSTDTYAVNSAVSMASHSNCLQGGLSNQNEASIETLSTISAATGTIPGTVDPASAEHRVKMLKEMISSNEQQISMLQMQNSKHREELARIGHHHSPCLTQTSYHVPKSDPRPKSFSYHGKEQRNYHQHGHPRGKQPPYHQWDSGAAPVARNAEGSSMTHVSTGANLHHISGSRQGNYHGSGNYHQQSRNHHNHHNHHNQNQQEQVPPIIRYFHA